MKDYLPTLVRRKVGTIVFALGFMLRISSFAVADDDVDNVLADLPNPNSTASDAQEPARFINSPPGADTLSANLTKDVADMDIMELVNVPVSPFTVSTQLDRGYLAVNSVSASRFDAPIRDLPFAIQAFNEAFIEDQKPRSPGTYSTLPVIRPASPIAATTSTKVTPIWRYAASRSAL